MSEEKRSEARPPVEIQPQRPGKLVTLLCHRHDGDGACAACEILALRGRCEKTERERDLAIAHDRQPYPTADAYDKACAALHRHEARAEKAEADLADSRSLQEGTATLLGEAEAENKDLREVNTFLSAAEDMHLANADTLRTRALKAEADVSEVDRFLAGRPKLEEFKTRIEKILYCLSAAKTAEADAARLKGMVAYARGAPDLVSVVSILTDALDGVTGADNVQEVRGELEILRTENAWLREAIEKAPHTEDCDWRLLDDGMPDSHLPCNCWKAAALAGEESE